LKIPFVQSPYFMLLTVSHAVPAGKILPTSLTGLTQSASLILSDRARQHHWQGEGALSLKFFPKGRAHYRVEGRSFCVRENQLLVLNRHQPYQMRIEEKTEVHSLCIFFQKDLAADVQFNSSSSLNQLLDQPFSAPEASIDFFEKPYPVKGSVQQKLLCLQRQLAGSHPFPAAVNETLQGIMYELLLLNGQTRREIDTLSASRISTRQELYRRLNTVGEYIRENYATHLTLHQLAGVACLSPNHLLRTFRQLYGQSPFGMVARLRMEKACQLLRTTALPVSDVCAAVGFESLSSFSGLFKRCHGVSPQQYRTQKR
jgi:AraC-like DNA-binding protein